MVKISCFFQQNGGNVLSGHESLGENEREGNAGDSKESEFSLDVVVGEEGGDSGEDDVDGEEYEREQHSTTTTTRRRRGKEISRL